MSADLGCHGANTLNKHLAIGSIAVTDEIARSLVPSTGLSESYPHLAAAGRRQGSIDHLQLVGIAEAPDVNNPVARLPHDELLATHGKKTFRGCLPGRDVAFWHEADERH
jgi:hypothetical protein